MKTGWVKNILGTVLLLAVGAVWVGRTAKAVGAEEEEIRKLLEDQAAAWSRGDLDAFMAGYWNSPELIFTSGAKIQRGWQATMDRYRKSYPDRAAMGWLTFSDLEIRILDRAAAQPAVAWVLGKYHLKREKDEPQGLFTLILQRFGKAEGGWKIVHDHTSSASN